jgi:hypothetical protein
VNVTFTLEYHRPLARAPEAVIELCCLKKTVKFLRNSRLRFSDCLLAKTEKSDSLCIIWWKLEIRRFEIDAKMTWFVFVFGI